VVSGCQHAPNPDCSSGLTDTMFCQMPNGFNLTFLQDPVLVGTSWNKNSYLLNASQPGQFYYNVFLTGQPAVNPGDPVQMDIEIPYPFVTQGAVPIQVHDGVGFNSSGCFVPSPSLSGCTITTEGGNLSTSGNPIIQIGDYSPQNVGTGTTHVHVSGCNVPASGLLYVTIHLDYGLKKTTGWTQNAIFNDKRAVHVPTGTSPFTDALSVIILNPQGYPFGWTESNSATSASETPQSSNTFKNNPGVLVQTIKSATALINPEGPVAGVKAQLYGPTNKLIATGTTDVNGVVFFNYKSTGKTADYKVKLPDYGLEVTVKLKANGFALGSFDNLP
jgi:hypothetical protein